MAGPMNLTIPVPTVTPGPDFAVDVSGDLGIVENHTHITGQGNPIPTAGLALNADLPLNHNGLNTVTYVLCDETGTGFPAGIRAIYFKGGDLWITNTSGQHVQITSGSTINASAIDGFTNLGGTTGAATYASGSTTFTFTSNTDTPAVVVGSGLRISQTGGTPNTVTFVLPGGLGATYSIAVPTGLPSTLSLIQMDTSGNMIYPATPTWTAITGAANWNPLEDAGYVKDIIGIVHLRGVIQAQAGAGTTAFTLPSGFRPSKAMVYMTGDGAYTNTMTINTNGTAVVNDASLANFYELSGIIFPIY